LSITSEVQVLGKLFNYLPLAFRFFPGSGPVQVLHPWMFPRMIVHTQSNQVAGTMIAAIFDRLFVMYVENPCRDVPATLTATIVVTAPDVSANDFHSPVVIVAHAGLHGQR
jgi:hypothetical protein